jgi:hypothetical protein
MRLYSIWNIRSTLLFCLNRCCLSLLDNACLQDGSVVGGHEKLNMFTLFSVDNSEELLNEIGKAFVVVDPCVNLDDRMTNGSLIVCEMRPWIWSLATSLQPYWSRLPMILIHQVIVQPCQHQWFENELLPDAFIWKSTNVLMSADLIMRKNRVKGSGESQSIVQSLPQFHSFFLMPFDCYKCRNPKLHWWTLEYALAHTPISSILSHLILILSSLIFGHVW